MDFMSVFRHISLDGIYSLPALDISFGNLPLDDYACCLRISANSVYMTFPNRDYSFA